MTEWQTVSKSRGDKFSSGHLRLKTEQMERRQKDMKTLKQVLSVRNGIVRNSASEKYFSIADLLFNPCEFIRFIVDLVDNH